MKAILVMLMLAGMASAQDSKPRVFLQANSHGNTWNARRDQSIEMAKDFQKHCPDVRISLAQNNADYTVILNHIEVGFSRDNQMEVANKSGDLLATREKGGIKGGVKEVCSIILADWQKPQEPQAAVPAQQGQQAQPPQDSQQGQDQAAAQQQAEPQTIQLGETSDQVRTALGQPDKVVNLGAKQIYVYKDLKITFVSEKVSDVQ
jgi:hypothetical protein